MKLEVGSRCHGGCKGKREQGFYWERPIRRTPIIGSRQRLNKAHLRSRYQGAGRQLRFCASGHRQEEALEGKIYNAPESDPGRGQATGRVSPSITVGLRRWLEGPGAKDGEEARLDIMQYDYMV